MFSYERTSKTMQLLCFQGREEDRLQMLYFSRATSSSNRKDAIAPIRPNDAQWTLCVTHLRHVNTVVAAVSSYFHKMNGGPIHWTQLICGG